MNQIELAQRYATNPSNFFVFLGAGASISAGMPSAYGLMQELKKRYYCSEENQNIDLCDMSNDGTAQKVQDFCILNGFPHMGAADEYSKCFKVMFSEDKERQRQFIEEIVNSDNYRSSLGHSVLSALIHLNKVNILFTTNFDDVIEKTFAEQHSKTIQPFVLEDAKSALVALNNKSFPLLCKLHGDFRHDSLKNISDDLAKQNEDFSTCFTAAGGQFGALVCGYSGRDESVISQFHQVLSNPNPFPHGLYWTVVKGSKLIDEVNQLIEAAKQKDVQAELVEIDTFDSFMDRVWNLFTGKPRDVDDKVRKKERLPVAIPLPQKGDGNRIIRLNALQIFELPQTCLKVTPNRPIDLNSFKEIKFTLSKDIIICKGEHILSWGKQETLEQGFKKYSPSVTEFDLSEVYKNLEHHWYFKPMLEEAIAKSLTSGKPLLVRRGKGFYLVIKRGAEQEKIKSFQEGFKDRNGAVPALSGNVPSKTFSGREGDGNHQVQWAEALKISVTYWDDKHWLNIEPDIWISPKSARDDCKVFIAQKKRARVSGTPLFNNTSDTILSAWINLLFDQKEQEFTTFDKVPSSSNPSFNLRKQTAYSVLSNGEG